MSEERDEMFLREIEAKAKEIHADAYPMSIGEIISLYRDGELDIHPEFQRFFRWSTLQKSKFIESILLGIPVPSIFVSQREDGVWDVVDGVQRLSTIFEFTGVLRDEKRRLIAPSSLLGTEYLPSLEGKVWEKADEPEKSFPSSLRIDFKRQKLDLKIIKKESDPNTKYDLFERLNTLGSQLSDQEVRNCLLVMINRGFYKWLESLCEYGNFIETIGLTDTARQQRYDMELALRFMVFRRIEEQELRGIKDVGDFLTRKTRALAADSSFKPSDEEKVFKGTFDAIYKSFGSESFRRVDRGRGRGGFLISVFEVVAIGLGHNLAKKSNAAIDPKSLKVAVGKLWKNDNFRHYSASGISASSRLPALIPLGRELLDIL